TLAEPRLRHDVLAVIWTDRLEESLRGLSLEVGIAGDPRRDLRGVAFDLKVLADELLGIEFPLRVDAAEFAVRLKVDPGVELTTGPIVQRRVVRRDDELIEPLEIQGGVLVQLESG